MGRFVFFILLFELKEDKQNYQCLNNNEVNNIWWAFLKLFMAVSFQKNISIPYIDDK